VEAALEVARAGLRADPVVVPPPALRPFLGFARLSPAALSAIARVVDQDDDFRDRVAASVDEDAVGRGGWLWLTRPDGWQDDLAAIENEDRERRASRAAEQSEARDERSAARRLAAAQAALTRAETVGEERRLELQRLQRELDDMRRTRTATDARVAELEAAVAGLETARATAVRNLKEVEGRLVGRATELKAVKARLRELEAEAPGAGPDERRREEVPADAGDAGATAPGPDLGAVARELERAAQGAAGLADGLAGLAAALGDRQAEATPSPLAPEPAGRGPAGAGAAARPGRRTPVALPGGLLDDSVAAAEHLLRTPDAVLVVDGYNVTMTGWPELGAGEQRHRLVALLSDLAARTCNRVEVVFDGAEVDGGAVAVPAPVRRWVRVRFSPPGVEADDVVLDLVAQLPAGRPVIVVSSDNRVREGARRGGANLLYSRQLLDTLGVGAG
ncbi:MAG TPA: NYN domain-containing protein, partial [Acidimicrobiales bacterium]|nr:NYN domain-containing protein [Acidimicrobiales bacterium]